MVLNVYREVLLEEDWDLSITCRGQLKFIMTTMTTMTTMTSGH